MKTTASFVQPNIGGTVSVLIDSTDGLVEGQTVVLAGGGFYVVQTVSDGSAHLLNLALVANLPSGGTVPRGAILAPSGAPGLGVIVPQTGQTNIILETPNVMILVDVGVPCTIGFFGATQPPDGSRIVIIDYRSHAAANPITITGNFVLPGAAPTGSVVLSLNDAFIDLLYVASNTLWYATGYSPGH
jgi:hypothetical protein